MPKTNFIVERTYSAEEKPRFFDCAAVAQKANYEYESSQCNQNVSKLRNHYS